MSLNFEHTFGKPQANNSSKDDRPKAQFWLNIGYPVTVKTESGEEQRFVSLHDSTYAQMLLCPCGETRVESALAAIK